jgi:hypothetical protein
MTRATAYQKRHAKARQRRRIAQERLARDRRQAPHAAEALQQALDDLGRPEDLMIEIEGRLRRQQKLRLNLMWADLGKRGVGRSFTRNCISFIVMREAGVNQALTFDQHFVQAGFQALMREFPRT